MSELKSPIDRLARLFRQGRDNWREKAIERHKKIRALEIKIRDLTLSRENWKQRALATELQLKQQNIVGDNQAKKKKPTQKKQT